MNNSNNKISIPDYHLHSVFSADCKSDINEIIKAARAKGINSICFTDHNDLDFPKTPDDCKFDLDIDNYIKTLSHLREENLGYSFDVKDGFDAKDSFDVKDGFDVKDSFDVRIGVEQGVMPTTCERLNSYTSEHPGLDFVICSSHVVDGFDPYYTEYWYYPDGTVKDAERLYQIYFEEMLYNVQHFHDYNVYGHIDYIFRYGPTPGKVTAEIFKEKYFPKYKDLFHEIMKTIIEDGKGIEINTGSLYRGMDYMHPHIEILKTYKELGGEILTFGSDAHDLEHIGYGFDNAAEIAKSIGFKYYTTFRSMKPNFASL